MSGVSGYAQSTANLTSLRRESQVSCYGRPSTSVIRCAGGSLHVKLEGRRLVCGGGGGGEVSRKMKVVCNSSTRPGGSGSDDSDSKNVLDAFFLGKALAEALNERIESTVGEFLSTVGRLQAEQQKQVQDFQEEVFERAKKAKEKAAREAMEAQGLIPKATTLKSSSVSNNGVTSTTSVSTIITVIPDSPAASDTPTYAADKDPNPAKDSVSGTTND